MVIPVKKFGFEPLNIDLNIKDLSLTLFKWWLESASYLTDYRKCVFQHKKSTGIKV